ncbi:MAG TPA: hypothetical protein VG868_04560, partial [Casimicrobiaceae bacterium]|nr:hypothetical protein [Casimicrobiaceae bacterium]
DRSAGPFWIGVGVLAASGFAALCRVGWVALRAVAARRDDTPLLVFLVTMTVAYVAPFVLTDFTDRYLLFVLPFVLALIAIAEPPGAGLPRRALAIVVIIAALVIEALAVHDYFAWNRARWDAIRDAQAQGATPSTLDGGFEYNGYFGYEARAARPGKSWWWVDDDRYVVAFGDVPGYTVLARYPVRGFLPRTPREIVLLERR